MAADEPTIDRIISETLKRHGGEDSQDPDVWEAQNELHDRRNFDPALAGNENYAIAKHYMLSRAMVATSQIPVEQMLVHIDAYDGLKGVALTPPEPGARHDLADPGKPLAALAVRKLTQGAWDGEKQRVCNSRPKPAFNPKAFTGYGAFPKILRA